MENKKKKELWEYFFNYPKKHYNIYMEKMTEYPEYIKPRDAYPKKTCLWTGGEFVMPEKMPVDISPGYSDQHKKLGGKSERTKNIRSATPRGFAKAVFLANAPHLKANIKAA